MASKTFLWLTFFSFSGCSSFAQFIQPVQSESQLPVTKYHNTRNAEWKHNFMNSSLLGLQEKTTYYRSHFKAIESDRHWPVFLFDWKLGVATILAFIGAALANAGGVGGGGLFVPMFNLLLEYDTKTSAALSKAMILGGAIASVCFNVQLKHPHQNKSLIDFEIALLLQPLLLVGISIGVMCNVMFPVWLITLMLCILLFMMSYKSFKKGIHTWQQESNHSQHKGQRSNGSPERPTANDEDKSAIDNAPSSTAPISLERTSHSSLDVRARSPTYVSAEESGLQIDEESLDLDEHDPVEGTERHIWRTASILEQLHMGHPIEAPWQKVNWNVCSMLVLVWLVFLAVQLGKVHVRNCSVLYWVLTFLQLPVSIAVTVLAARRLYVQGQATEAADRLLGPPARGEVHWGYSQVATYPLYALLAGTMGGLLGIGGGMVMGPVLLELGVLPQVTAASTTFMVVFSSSLSVIEFYLLGRIPIDVAIYFSGLCMLAAFAGLSVVRAVVVKSGRASIIVFALAVIIGASALVILVLGSKEIVEDYLAGQDMSFHSIC